MKKFARINTPNYTSMYVHIVVGTESYEYYQHVRHVHSLTNVSVVTVAPDPVKKLLAMICGMTST
jgi:hypothetical protein